MFVVEVSKFFFDLRSVAIDDFLDFCCVRWFSDGQVAHKRFSSYYNIILSEAIGPVFVEHFLRVKEGLCGFSSLVDIDSDVVNDKLICGAETVDKLKAI